MNPNIFKLISNAGLLIRTLKDIQFCVGELMRGDLQADEAKKVLLDLIDLLGVGVIKIPNVTDDEMKNILDQLKKAIE